MSPAELALLGVTYLSYDMPAGTVRITVWRRTVNGGVSYLATGKTIEEANENLAAQFEMETLL